MFKKVGLIVVVGVFVSRLAFAGDTVTVNIPGGATQTVSSSSIAADINTATQSGTFVGGGGENSSIAIIKQDASTGLITATTTGGQTYYVSSTFIGSILGYYK